AGTYSRIETIVLNGGAATNSLTFSNTQAGLEIDGTTRTDDSLVLANGGNSVNILGIEQVTGGAGADAVNVLDVTALALTATAVESILGSAGNQTLSLVNLVSAGMTVDLGAGTDTLSLANGANT